MSLEGTYDPDNIFAKILRGEIPNHTIFETDDALAFMDAFPQSRGHCLVIPKTPARNILEISQTDFARYTPHIRRLAVAVEAALRPDGVVVLQYNGAPAGQSVFHLHFHVIPRYEGADLAGHGQAGRADDGELADLAARITAALPAA